MLRKPRTIYPAAQVKPQIIIGGTKIVPNIEYQPEVLGLLSAYREKKKIAAINNHSPIEILEALRPLSNIFVAITYSPHGFT